MTDAPIPKATRDLVEIAVASLDRLAALVATWRPNGDGFLVADERDGWERTALEARAAVDRVLDGLDAGPLRDAAETCRRRVEEVLVREALIHADTPDRIHKARTALGIAGEVLRPSWAQVSLRRVAKVVSRRLDNLTRTCRDRNVRMARCHGEVYADPHELAVACILEVEQIERFFLRNPSNRLRSQAGARDGLTARHDVDDAPTELAGANPSPPGR